MMADPPRSIAPSLEDVFVQIVSRRNKAPGDAGSNP
jgi:hypothetical protein